MQTIETTSLTDKNLDRLADFLNRELEGPGLAEQIPDGAYIFHGSYNDAALTQANLELASKIFLGMTLGYIEDAPVMMIFEYKAGKQTIIDLSSKAQKAKVQQFIEMFQEQSRQDITGKVNELLAA